MEMVTVTIQVEARAKFLKTIIVPKDEALELSNADDETIICNVDFEDIEEISDYELIDIHIANK